MKFTPNLTRNEMRSGIIAMMLCLLILPVALALVLPDLSAARLNFTSYFITAGVVVYLLRRFLLQNLQVVLAHPFYSFYYACLGYLAYLTLNSLAEMIVYTIAPAFVNLNNQNITTQLDAEFGLMVLTVTVLAPIAEECFFRGLLLRGFYDRSPVLAWVLSAGLFSAIHVVGYLGSYSPMGLLLAFIQYLPGGIALGFSYHRGRSIFSPIMTHAIINLMALYSAAR